MSVDLDQLRTPPVAEKLRIVEVLWDDIHETDEPLIVQSWHETESRRRAAELDANPNIALTRDELWKRACGLNE